MYSNNNNVDANKNQQSPDNIKIDLISLYSACLTVDISYEKSQARKNGTIYNGESIDYDDVAMASYLTSLISLSNDKLEELYNYEKAHNMSSLGNLAQRPSFQGLKKTIGNTTYFINTLRGCIGATLDQLEKLKSSESDKKLELFGNQFKKMFGTTIIRGASLFLQFLRLSPSEHASRLEKIRHYEQLDQKLEQSKKYYMVVQESDSITTLKEKITEIIKTTVESINQNTESFFNSEQGYHPRWYTTREVVTLLTALLNYESDDRCFVSVDFVNDIEEKLTFRKQYIQKDDALKAPGPFSVLPPSPSSNPSPISNPSNSF